MKISFKTNDYLLTWNLLYGASISPKIHNFKQKLWTTYKKQYNSGAKDKDEMLLDIDNYIPNDDTIYNLVFETELFETIKNGCEKYRLELMKIWDENKKMIIKHLKEIVRIPLKENYNIIILHPSMDTILTNKNTPMNFAWGFKKDLENKLMAMTNIVYTIIKNEIGEFDKEYKEIVQAILELAIHNELYTRLSGESNYLQGDKTLTYLKRQIYPYWLMYLGCDKEDMTHYMMRDKIAFDIENYTMETPLKKVDLCEFIRFCIKNQKHIIRINNLEII
ncbi:MAG: hypothetical protein E7168_03640 [Firmicutes bacterium]|nr:hypothetical protein [Bacillota bacterium]